MGVAEEDVADEIISTKDLHEFNTKINLMKEEKPLLSPMKGRLLSPRGSMSIS